MLKLAGIASDSIVDGPGIRTTLFAQGCPHHCPGCHNPETWTFDGGAEYSVESLMEMIRSNPLCRGVTFSGGEPFAQAEAFASLAEKLHAAGYEIASYSGYTFEELIKGTTEQKNLLSEIDILIDGRFILSERSLDLNFRGSRNQRILNVPASIQAGEPVPEMSARWHGEYEI